MNHLQLDTLYLGVIVPFQDGYHQLESLVTMHFLEKHIPSEDLILDAEGEPKRYTIELAKRGYNIVLSDFRRNVFKSPEEKKG